MLKQLRTKEFLLVYLMLSFLLKKITMCKKEVHKTKKVYRPRHDDARTKAYKRDKSKNKLNPLDYVGSEDFSFVEERG